MNIEEMCSIKCPLCGVVVGHPCSSWEGVPAVCSERVDAINLINKVRCLTALSSQDITDDLILAMDGSPESRANQIVRYRNGL